MANDGEKKEYFRFSKALLIEMYGEFSFHIQFFSRIHLRLWQKREKKPGDKCSSETRTGEDREGGDEASFPIVAVVEDMVYMGRVAVSTSYWGLVL